MYQKINLPYTTLEPYISDRTLTLHYNNHYLNYLNKLNELVGDNKYNKIELFSHLDEFNIDIRDSILFNLGGVVNHELYFNNFSLNKNTIPVGSIKDQINKQYKTFNDFKKEFKDIALKLTGAGYTFLVINENKDLQIINMSNQESPYSYGMVPIIALDLWEHAYYLDYQNNKSKYIDAFFEILDFNKINKLYEENKL